VKPKRPKSDLKLPNNLQAFLIGGGRIENHVGTVYRLGIPADSKGYTDAQLDNYQGLPRDDFPIRPPFHLKVQARVSRSSPKGTFGFGLWNDPFAFSVGLAGAERRWPCAPNALWFFYGSPPNKLKFNPESTGQGFTASCVVSPPIPTIALVPGASIAFVTTRIPFFRRAIIAQIQSSIHAEEAILDVDFTNWHTYEINWDVGDATFSVDQRIVHRCSSPPTCPLGLVIWIDNQFAILSRSEGIRFGIIPLKQPQWMEIAYLRMKSG
jgi:hypothetical protein